VPGQCVEGAAPNDLIHRLVLDQCHQPVQVAVIGADQDAGERGRRALAQRVLECLDVPGQAADRREGAGLAGLSDEVEDEEYDPDRLLRSVPAVGKRLEERQERGAASVQFSRTRCIASRGISSPARASSSTMLPMA
jgi:hypothetical protein